MLILHEKTKIEPVAANTEIDIAEVSDVTDSEEIFQDAAAKEEMNQELFNKACENETNRIIQNAWNLINDINSLITTVDYDYKKDDKDDVKDILNSVIDDITIDIGMLYKIISMLNEKTTELLDAGEEKAEEIIQAEPEEAADKLDPVEVDLEVDETTEEAVEENKNEE